jgi:hypothetical protein
MKLKNEKILKLEKIRLLMLSKEGIFEQVQALAIKTNHKMTESFI